MNTHLHAHLPKAKKENLLSSSKKNPWARDPAFTDCRFQMVFPTATLSQVPATVRARLRWHGSTTWSGVTWSSAHCTPGNFYNVRNLQWCHVRQIFYSYKIDHLWMAGSKSGSITPSSTSTATTKQNHSSFSASNAQTRALRMLKERLSR